MSGECPAFRAADDTSLSLQIDERRSESLVLYPESFSDLRAGERSLERKKLEKQSVDGSGIAGLSRPLDLQVDSFLVVVDQA